MGERPEGPLPITSHRCPGPSTVAPVVDTVAPVVDTVAPVVVTVAPVVDTVAEHADSSDANPTWSLDNTGEDARR